MMLKNGLINTCQTFLFECQTNGRKQFDSIGAFDHFFSTRRIKLSTMVYVDLLRK